MNLKFLLNKGVRNNADSFKTTHPFKKLLQVYKKSYNSL